MGNYPPYVVNATENGHVQAAVSFAKRWNLRLNVKNTGHSGGRRYVPLIKKQATARVGLLTGLALRMGVYRK